MSQQYIGVIFTYCQKYWHCIDIVGTFCWKYWFFIDIVGASDARHRFWQFKMRWHLMLTTMPTQHDISDDMSPTQHSWWHFWPRWDNVEKCRPNLAKNSKTASRNQPFLPQNVVIFGQNAVTLRQHVIQHVVRHVIWHVVRDETTSIKPQNGDIRDKTKLRQHVIPMTISREMLCMSGWCHLLKYLMRQSWHSQTRCRASMSQNNHHMVNLQKIAAAKLMICSNFVCKTI